MYCYKENNIKKEVYRTNETLEEVFHKKKQKIISKIKEIKTVNPKIDIDDAIERLKTMQSGRLLEMIAGFTYQIVKEKDYLFIYKEFNNYHSVRFWSTNDSDDFEERMRKNNI